MQQFQEATAWFPSNAECYNFHLSMRHQGHQEGASRPFPSTAHHNSVGLAVNASTISPGIMTPTSALSGFSIASPVTDSFPSGSALPPHAPLLAQHPQRIPLPRNNSFPPAGANGRLARSTATSSTNNSPPPSVATIPPISDVEPKPSLVKHLQRIHGLTKKRNYGLQTSRAPFIRDETASASAPYPPSPSHSVDPVNGRPRRNTGVHTSKNKKGDDPRRPRRGSVHVGPPESARVSSPDSDSSTSVSAPSPTTTVTGMLASPTGPVSVSLQMAGGAIPVSSPPLNLAEAAYATVPPPSLWQNETLVQQQQQQQQTQQAAAPANVTPAFTDVLPSQQLASQAPALIAQAQVQAQAQAQPSQAHTHLRGAAAPPPGSSSSYSNMPHGNPDSPVAYSTTTALTTSNTVRSSFVTQPSSNTTSSGIAAPGPAAAPTTDDGDKPFIFYPEYEDALVPQAPMFASLPATTQPTPMTEFWSTASAAEYSHILNPAATPGLVRGGNPTSVYDMPMYDSPVHPQPTHPLVTSHPHHVQPGVVYASEQCSSLQSWAGY